MQTIQPILLVVHLIIAVLMIGVILLQKSEGGALGIGGGGGGSGNLFSTRGVGNALTRTTAILAVCFFLTSMGLTVLAIRGAGGGGGSIFNTAPAAQQTQPVAPVAPADGGGSVLPQLQPQAPAPVTPPAQQ
jgi:preprotein translocase subunit SecG